MYEPPKKFAKKSDDNDDKRCKQSIVTAEVAAALDRCGITDDEALFLLSAVANALGHNLKDLKLSRSSICRDRQKYRDKIKEDIRETFNPNTPLIIHWDGKRLKDTTCSLKEIGDVERLAIVASGMGNNKILSIPKLKTSTGQSQADAIYESIIYWNISDKVKRMAFDTTATNTGPDKGAAHLLDAKFEKPLLFLACRHHIAELFLKCAFCKTIEPVTSGPEIKMFIRFRDQWNDINVNNIKSGMEDTEISKHFPDGVRTQLITFIKSQLEFHVKHERHDYAEFLHLALLFLGEKIENYGLNKPDVKSQMDG